MILKQKLLFLDPQLPFQPINPNLFSTPNHLTLNFTIPTQFNLFSTSNHLTLNSTMPTDFFFNLIACLFNNR